MWSILNEQQQQQQQNPRLDSSGFDLSRIFFLSSLLCLFMQGHNMTDKRVLQASGLPRGETQHKKKKKWAEKFSSRLSLPSRHHCVVYCIWKCRLSTYCIYYQPPPALKPAAKTKLWTISEKKKEKKTQLFNQSSNVFKEFKVSFRFYCKYNRNSIFCSLVKYKLCGCSVFWSFSCLFFFQM